MTGKGCILVGTRFDIMPFSPKIREALDACGVSVTEGGRGGFYVNYNTDAVAQAALSKTFLELAAERINNNGSRPK